MKRLWLLALAAIAFTGVAATTYTITQLTLNTNPSSGTLVEIYDPSATPKSGKYLLTNLATKAYAVNKAGDTMAGNLGLGSGSLLLGTNALTASGTDLTWNGASIGGNVVNTGDAVIGMIPVYTDTSGIAITPTNTLGALSVGTLSIDGMTADTVPYFDSDTNMVGSLISSTELNQLNNITNNVQTQINELRTRTITVAYEHTNSAATYTTYSWTKPANAKTIKVVTIGGGGGGGSGRVGAAGTARYGGGGGAGGAYNAVELDASLVGASLTITVGGGGGGGAAVAVNDTDGVNGTNGVSSSFGTLCVSGYGVAGNGGTAVSGGAGYPYVGTGYMFLSGSPTAGNKTTASTPDGAAFGVGGGGGGGVGTTDTVGNGAPGAASAFGYRSGAGSIGGNGDDKAQYYPGFGGSGGGGNGSNTGNGGDGGNAGRYGSGGGGGGGVLNGASSGKGGNGASGLVVVTTTLSL